MKLKIETKKKYWVLLFLTVVIAAFLRFYQLGINPPALTWDEAAWGYNAYSIGINGQDEFGRFLPLDFLESFGDFKPPIYAYLDIIPVKIFGLNEFAARFPSALFGTLTVLLTFFLVRRIFQRSKNKELIALLSAFFLAISPWHILLSRAAFEANIATFFIIAGVWAFLAGIQDRRWYLIISAIFFALSFYTFNTARIVSPLLVLILTLAFRKELLIRKKETISALILGALIVFPIIGFLISPQAGLRFKEVNIFSDINVVKTANQEIANDQNAFWSKLIHNRRVLYSIQFVKHYFDNLNPNFLFIKGDGNPKFSTQDVGQMYIFDIVFFISGILFLFRKKEGNWWIIPLWLLIGIIPAATARETPHALRIETTLPTFQIFVAYGFIQLINKIEKYRKFIVYCLLLILSVNFVYFYHNYFSHYSHQYSGEWQYGYKESIDYVKSVENNFDYIQVTNALGRPYIYYLFYTKTNPDEFRKTADIQRDAFGFVTVKSFGKYIFPTDYNYSLSKTKKVLYINTPYKLPENIKIQKTFYLLNGQAVLVAYTI
ncbi:MAG: glycosyltransferase family 39 protein [Patescibacteria group bacterium]